MGWIVAIYGDKVFEILKKVVTLHPLLENTVEKFGCLQPLEKMLKLR